MKIFGRDFGSKKQKPVPAQPDLPDVSKRFFIKNAAIAPIAVATAPVSLVIEAAAPVASTIAAVEQTDLVSSAAAYIALNFFSVSRKFSSFHKTLGISVDEQDLGKLIDDRIAALETRQQVFELLDALNWNRVLTVLHEESKSDFENVTINHISEAAIICGDEFSDRHRKSWIEATAHIKRLGFNTESELRAFLVEKGGTIIKKVFTDPQLLSFEDSEARHEFLYDLWYKTPMVSELKKLVFTAKEKAWKQHKAYQAASLRNSQRQVRNLQKQYEERRQKSEQAAEKRKKTIEAKKKTSFIIRRVTEPEKAQFRITPPQRQVIQRIDLHYLCLDLALKTDRSVEALDNYRLGSFQVCEDTRVAGDYIVTTDNLLLIEYLSKFTRRGSAKSPFPPRETRSLLLPSPN